MPPSFAEHRAHFDLLRAAALRAVDPAAAVRRSLSRADFAAVERVFIVAAGKAALAMSQAAADILGDRLTSGIVSAPDVPANVIPPMRFIAGGHPLPNDASIAAGHAAAELLAQTTDRDLVLALVSGGGSALIELPRPGLTLADLQSATNALLQCGATINEINCIRTRLSRLKGGGLARLAYPARVLALIVSDVVGNPLHIIASGPTVPPASSAADAQAVVEKYRLQSRLPVDVLRCLQEPAAADVAGTLRVPSHTAPSTPLPADRPAPPSRPQTIENRIIASNRLAAEAAIAAARDLGYDARLVADDRQGEARDVGAQFAQWLAPQAGQGPKCYVIGGETTVTVRGHGKGGRNQELALAAAIVIDGMPNVAIAALATDGIDGPTDAAGAIATGKTVPRARALGLDARRHLLDNDSYPFFSALGDLILTGPTGTNVNDLIFGLVYG
jgi:glycerate 2-kinase